MYSEGRDTFVRDTVIKILLVVLFVFLLIWLFPMPNLNPFYDRIFAENAKSMKEVARSYYTVERLPKNIGEKKTLTLQEMLDKKMIIPFVDKDGKLCDATKSYVEVIKMDTDYLFKTYLSCPSKTDYVVDYFGCYDVCKNDNCEQKCTKSITEYEFTRTVNNKIVDHYVCPVGYILNGSKCIKTVENTDTQPAIISCKSGYKYNETSKMCEKTITSEKNADIKCPSEFIYDAASKKCLKSTGESKNPDITCATYPGYEYNSSTGKCEKPIIVDEKPAPKTDCTAYPGYNYNPISKMCEKSIPDEKNADKIDCTAYPGYNYNPTSKMCEKLITDEKPAPKTDCSAYVGFQYNSSTGLCEKSTTTRICSSDYTYDPVDKRCEKAGTSVIAWDGKTYTGWACSYKWYSYPQTESYMELFTRSDLKSKTVGKPGCSGSDCEIWWYSYDECRRSRSCSNGYTYVSSNNTCTKPITLIQTASCSGTISGQNCIVKSTEIPKYICTAYPDYDLVGTKCVKSRIDPKTPGYTCEAYPGYDLVGTKCIKPVIDPKTPAYTCAIYPDYKLVGTKCEKMGTDKKTPTKTCAAYPDYKYNPTTDKCEKTTNETTNPTYECKVGTKKPSDQTKCIVSEIDKIDSYYGCPTSYILNETNNTCYRTSKTDEKKDAEVIYKDSTKTEYTWSKYSTLSGWKATGKTRTKEVACTE